MSDGLFAISDLGNGRLSIGPRPKLQDYTKWLAALKQHEVSHVLSLISNDEVERYSLQGEARALVDCGIGFTHFPIDDYQIPDVANFRDLINDLKRRLESGDHLFIHCAGGIGRAGTTAACLLVEHRWDADEAMQRVTQMRGQASPETDEQAEFIRQW